MVSDPLKCQVENMAKEVEREIENNGDVLGFLQCVMEIEKHSLWKLSDEEFKSWEKSGELERKTFRGLVA